MVLETSLPSSYQKDSKVTLYGHSLRIRGDKLVHQRQTSQRLRQASLLARTEAPCWALALGQPVSAWAESAWQSDQQEPLRGLTGHDRQHWAQAGPYIDHDSLALWS